MAGSISFVVRYRRTNNYSASLKIKCVSDPVLFKEWQENTLIILQEAYQKTLDEYNEALQLQQVAITTQTDQEGNENFSNTALNRLIEERELKRACIEMLSKPYCYELGKRFYNCKTYTCTSCEEEEIEKWACC